MKRDKAVKLYNSITNISDEQIEAAGALPRKRRRWVKYAAVAACLAVAVAAGAVYKSARVERNLPMLQYTEPSYGNGFEGYMAYDISELSNGNPWTEDLKIKTLPVYENHITYDIVQNHYGYSVDEMWEKLYELVDRFGLDKDNVTYSDDAPEEWQVELYMKVYEKEGMLPLPDDYFGPRTVWAEDGNTTIRVSLNGAANISFESDKLFPQEYDLGSYSDACKAAEYLKKEYVLGEYKDLLGLKDPQISISGSDYNIYGERGNYGIRFYDKGKNIVEDIVNYNFQRVNISGWYHEAFRGEEGYYETSISYNTDSLEKHTTKLGDYPIITADEARKLLLDGYYATSVVQWDMPGEEYIAKVELIYRTDIREKFFMPYYRFLIELPEDINDNGTKTFGAYYVPAVEGRYIENMPKYDGGFN